MINSLKKIRRIRVTNGAKLAALCISLGVIAACSTTDAPGPLEPTGPVGRVRLVNLITDPNRNRVNVLLENQVFTVDLQYAQGAPANLPAPATATYSPVYTGTRSFVLKRTADTTVVVSTLNFAIAENLSMTVYAIGGTNGAAVSSFITTDPDPAVVSTATRVRVINMSPSAGAVDVFITAIGADLSTATPVATGLGYQQTSPYFNVASAAYQIRAVPAGTAPANRNGAVNMTLASNATPAPPAFAVNTARTVVLADRATTGLPGVVAVIPDK